MLLQTMSFIEPHSVVEAAAIGAVVGLGKVWDHFTAKPQRGEIRAISKAVDDLRNDVRDLKAFVVGPDGSNGLRSEVRDVKERIGGLEDRERDRLHGRYAK